MNVKSAVEARIDRSKWKILKFSDIVENIREKIVPSESGIKHYVGLEHLDSGSLHIKRFGETSSLKGDKLKAYKGDLIFAKRNAYLKRVALVEFDVVASAHSMILRGKPKNVLPEFLPFFLMSETFWQRAIEISVGSLSPTINWRTIAKQEFLLPPKDQQAALAELLWAMDAVVEGDIDALSTLKILFESWLNSSINTEKSWKRLPLAKVAKVQTGAAKNKRLSELDDAIEIPYLRVANVQDGYLDLEEVKSIFIQEKDYDRYKLELGDVLLTEGGDFDKLGRGYVWQNELEKCIHQNHVFAVRAEQDQLSPWFLSLVTRSRYGKQYFLRCAKKTSNLATINSSQLKEFRVFVPTIEIQEKVIKEGSELESLISKTEDKLSSSRSLLRSLINQIF